ncbi:MAG: phage integrase N-terminal domain-containing protein [Pseudomonadota bacterium]
MRQLNFDLKNLVLRSSDGSFGTQAARHRILQQIAHELHELGYRGMTATSLKPKHVEAIVQHWKAKELSEGTMKNRMSHIRWWAQKIDKAPVVARSNEHYDIGLRTYVTGENKGRDLDAEKLEKVTDHHTKISLQLQQAFGLRREEAIKFSPTYAIREDKLVLKATWTKGGKAREIPIRTQQQRAVLDAALRLVGRGSLIPVHKNYVQQLRTYERNTIKASLDRNHGLRHTYAQDRYRDITGWESPVRGGPDRRKLSAEDRQIDREARLQVSRELGHERIGIVASYLG